MRFFGYTYNDLVICKDSPDYLGIIHFLSVFQPWSFIAHLLLTKIRFRISSILFRHEIFSEFCRPQRSFSWKSQIRFNIYMGGGGGCTILCLLADRQQCWDGTTYIPHYQPILNTESSQVAGVCTTSKCSIA